MKKYKQFIIGLLLGSLLFSTLGVFAANELINIKLNKLQAFDSNGISRIKFEPVTTSGVNYYELQFFGQGGNEEGIISGTNGKLNIVGRNKLILDGGNDKVYFTSDVDFQGKNLNFSNATVNGLDTNSHLQKNHNHGIKPGTKLAITDGRGKITGYVEWTEDGGFTHSHNIE